MKEKLVITMNKIAKIMSVVLSVTLVIGVTVAMLVSAFAATAPKFSVKVLSEDEKEVKVAFVLEDGSFTAIDFQVNASDWSSADKSTGLTLSSIKKSDIYKDFADAQDVEPIFAANPDNGKVSVASTNPYDAKGEIFIFTLKKTDSAKKNIVSSDIVAEIFSCMDADNSATTASVANNIPTEVVTTTTTAAADVTTTTADADVTTTTADADVTTTTAAADVTTTTADADVTTTTAAADVTTTTAAADVTTTTAAAADVTTTKAADVTTSTKAADATTTNAGVVTTTAASSTSGDVVNPKTGDRLTATSAVVALLAISGAAVVALRKKED